MLLCNSFCQCPYPQTVPNVFGNPTNAQNHFFFRACMTFPFIFKDWFDNTWEPCFSGEASRTMIKSLIYISKKTSTVVDIYSFIILSRPAVVLFFNSERSL